jgi:choline dehydrogenase
MTDAREFDFIVTGAGCAVASRLSESGRHRVLLLEAGIRDSNPRIHIPIGYARAYATPRINWMFDSAPEQELKGRTLWWIRAFACMVSSACG